MLPYFATNGAIVLERTTEHYRVLTERTIVTIDTYPPVWAVDLSPNWLHTDDEAEDARVQASFALREYLSQQARGYEQDGRKTG